MQSKRYFTEQVLPKRPYLKQEWCETVIRAPLRAQAQPDGRMRFCGVVIDRETAERAISGS